MKDKKETRGIRDVYEVYKKHYQITKRVPVEHVNPIDKYLQEVNPYYYPPTNEIRYER